MELDLDFAIAHFERIARESQQEALNAKNDDGKDWYACKEAYEQFADWMGELKERRKCDAWHTADEIPPFGENLMIRLLDKHSYFNYYVMGFHNGRFYQTYLFEYSKDPDMIVTGWKLCPKEE